MRLRWQSLRTRLVAGVLLTTVLSMWLGMFIVSRQLRVDMQAAISSQQFSTVSLIAAEIDRSVRERQELLQVATHAIAGGTSLHPSQAQTSLEQQRALALLFNWGIIITDAQGVAIASIPENLQRVGTAYGDVPAIATLIRTGQPQVSEPMIGKHTGKPVVTIAVPIRSPAGQLLGIALGVTNLEAPNFLDEISTAKYGRTGDFLLSAPQSRVFIASSDKRRVMKAGPPPGINPVYDRYLAGHEGSGVALSSRGVEELSSSKRIPSTGWLMQAVLPTEEAFAPIQAMQRHLLMLSLLLTLAATGLAWWWIQRQLSPLEAAARQLDWMRNGEVPRQPLPVYQDDEIGKLSNAFNGLLEVIVAQEAQAAENTANRRLRKILSHVPGMVFQYRLDTEDHGAFPFASDAVRTIYGLAPDEVEVDARKIRAMLHPEDSQRFFDSLHHSAQTLEPWKIDYRIHLPDGREKWLRIDAVPEKKEENQITWYGFVMDISATKAMESELRIAAATFESQEGIFITDAKGVILRVNHAFTNITGYTENEVVGQMSSFFSTEQHDPEFYAKQWEALQQNGFWWGEIWNRRKNGEVFAEWVTISAVKDSQGQTTHYVSTFTDITEHKKSEEKIHNLAFFDPLTNLPNRRLLLDRIRQAMVGSQRSRQYGALIFIDLDQFKVLNDTKGHDIGDELLKQAAGRLSSCVREGDTVARLGGDEFIVLLQDLGQEAREAAATTEIVAEKLRQSIALPYDLAGAPYLLSASIGVTLFVDKEPSVDVLLKQADLALYQAKEAGRNTVRFFDPAMQQELNRRAEMEAGLRQALEEGKLQLYSQPQVDGKGHLVGAEALLRWFPEQDKAIPPAEFIPLAEESGLILPLGHWVLETACAQLQAWAQHPSLSHLVLAINVSPRQFGQPHFVEQVKNALERFGIPPGRLKLELTESVVLSNVEEVIARMQALKKAGVSFSLDDFGTGYSSLAYLKRLPIDQVKIDQGFIREVAHNPDDAAIVEAIIGLGGILKLSIIAEGVETPDQHEFLQRCACNAYQGYLFGRPMPMAAFEQFAADKATPAS